MHTSFEDMSVFDKETEVCGIVRFFVFTVHIRIKEYKRQIFFTYNLYQHALFSETMNICGTCWQYFQCFYILLMMCVIFAVCIYNCYIDWQHD